MGNIMSLMQLPKVIDAVNELALKVQKLEVQVKSLLDDKANRNATPKPIKKTD
jgi:hypothetical protein